MEGIKLIKRPRLRNPHLVVAWPGMGEVAFRATAYLVEQLKAEEFASIEPEPFFYLTGGVIEKGILSIPEMPYGKFYYWKDPVRRNDLIIFISNAQPDLAKAEAYSQKIIQLAKAFKVKALIGFAAMPQAIDHMHSPGVWYAGTSEELNKNLKKYNLNLLSEGQISGMNGLFLGLAKKEGLNGYCLLGEVPLYTIQIENPKAAYVVLEALGRILGIRLNLVPLSEQARAMDSEINKLLDFLKIDIGSLGPIGEEEIEKIKKTLSQLTKLPGSVKEKIEKLFKDAGTDISRAGELKGELDKWSVYKEYEDRFLDLFKKKEDKGN